MFHVLLPGPLETNTGGFIYDRQIIAGLTAQGVPITLHDLGFDFPFPSLATQKRAADVLAQLPDGAWVLGDGLALGALPDLVQRHAERLAFIALIHLPLCAAPDLSKAQKTQLFESEQMVLQHVQHIIVTSNFTGTLMARFGVEHIPCEVVLPGVDRVVPRWMYPEHPRRLLCVANVTPGKGHLDLVEALARLTAYDWHLTCLGSLTMNPAYVAQLQARITDYALTERITLQGAVAYETVQRAYPHADLFVLASVFESYGMALAEALAHDLPVISTTGGAIPHTVPSEAGLLVPPHDVPALTEALQAVLNYTTCYHALAEGAQRTNVPTWTESVAQFAACLQKIGTI